MPSLEEAPLVSSRTLEVDEGSLSQSTRPTLVKVLQRSWSHIGWLCISLSAICCAIGLSSVASRGQLQQLRTTAVRMDEKAAVLPMPDLFCFTVMGVPAREQGLLLSQKSKHKGLFECPDWAVFASTKIPPCSHVIEGLQTQVPSGGQWNTALNTPVFAAIWKKVLELPEFKAHAWTVKLDPDTVFLPARLESFLPKNVAPTFLVNCNEGLHGPIEVVSKAAVENVQWETCGNIQQEDLWLQSCLFRSGALPRPAFPGMLLEKGCVPRIQASCGTANVAFHPKKTFPEWWSCWLQAFAFPQPGWTGEVRNTRCEPGAGGDTIPGQAEPFSKSMSPADCQRACERVQACEAVIILESQDPTPCQMRTNLELSKCVAASGYSVWAKPLPTTTTASATTVASTTTATAVGRSMPRIAPNQATTTSSPSNTSHTTAKSKDDLREDLGTWQEWGSLNCFHSFASEPISVPSYVAENLEDCLSECVEHRDCDAVVYAVDNKRCWLRQNLDIDKCSISDRFRILVRPHRNSRRTEKSV